MRKRLWKIDSVFVDLEDRDAAVSLIHEKSLIEVVVKFRLSPHQLDDNAIKAFAVDGVVGTLLGQVMHPYSHLSLPKWEHK